MQTTSLVFGILSTIGMFVGFLPCLGSLNWIFIPLAAVGLIISIIALATAEKTEPKGKSIAGIIMCGIALVFCIIRLVIGAGVV